MVPTFSPLYCGHDHHSDDVFYRKGIFLGYGLSAATSPPWDWEGKAPNPNSRGARVVEVSSNGVAKTWIQTQAGFENGTLLDMAASLKCCVLCASANQSLGSYPNNFVFLKKDKIHADRKLLLLAMAINGDSFVSNVHGLLVSCSIPSSTSLHPQGRIHRRKRRGNSRPRILHGSRLKARGQTKLRPKQLA